MTGSSFSGILFLGSSTLRCRRGGDESLRKRKNRSRHYQPHKYLGACSCFCHEFILLKFVNYGLFLFYTYQKVYFLIPAATGMFFPRETRPKRRIVE
jgi:hypothetical protein